MLLAVSKGAMLGLLVFAVVWARSYLSRGMFLFVAFIAGGLGLAFVSYS